MNSIYSAMKKDNNILYVLSFFGALIHVLSSVFQADYYRKVLFSRGSAM